MKCPHCNQEHPEGYQFCPIKGKRIDMLKACTNQSCTNYGKHILPVDSMFCPSCGYKLNEDNSRTNSKHIDGLSKDNETLNNILKKRALSQIISSLLNAVNIIIAVH